MAALDELHHQCVKRGWRLAMTGRAHFSDGTPAPPSCPAMIVDGFEVRGPYDDFTGAGRELLARVPIDPLAVVDFDQVALELARALERQGLTP